MIKIILSKPFNLNDTVSCGQIFRFYKQEDNSYDIILNDRVINVYEKDNYLFVSSDNEDNLEYIITEYFDLNNDYENINSSIVKLDSKINDAVLFSKGLKMIKQEPFETIIEYIISANNGVPQIASAMNNIATNYGKKILFNNKEYYLFPSYEDLKEVTEEEYHNCKVGFRDKYIYQIISKLNNNEFDINLIYDMDTNKALEYLMSNVGIGPKVASCILLFAYQRYDVFPIDTWVKKIMKDRYNIEGEKNIRKFAKDTYGNYSGLAIQYLFNESRNKTK